MCNSKRDSPFVIPPAPDAVGPKRRDLQFLLTSPIADFDGGSYPELCHPGRRSHGPTAHPRE